MRSFYVTAQWKRLRQRAIARAGNKCERRGSGGRKLTAHHVERRAVGGADKLSNIEVLCYACHPREHASERREKIRLSKTKYARRLLSESLSDVERAKLQWRLHRQLVAKQTPLKAS